MGLGFGGETQGGTLQLGSGSSSTNLLADFIEKATELGFDVIFPALTLLAPFVASFPPYAAFACRLNCPETLYYPRPYCSTQKNNAANALCPENLLSLLEVLSLFGLGVSASGIALTHEEDRMILLCIFAFTAAAILLCIRYFKRCREKTPRSEIAASIFFRCTWLAFWFFLLALTPFWRFIIEGGF